MKAALINDIQGHVMALDLVLQAIGRQQPDIIVCLGDVASGPYPSAVLARLSSSGCLCVMGNMDARILSPPENAADNPVEQKYLEIDRWCHDQLTNADRAFIRGFERTVSVDLAEDCKLLCCHGSPRSFDDIIEMSTPEAGVLDLLGDDRAEIIATGHMHRPMRREINDTLIVNPGSVGLPHEAKNPGDSAGYPLRAEFAIVEASTGEVSVDFYAIKYSVEALRQSFLASGMPHAEWYGGLWQGWRDAL